ncbi:Hypothetical predicted protein [Scomber scombrus]|uniref:Uncharacterized protein n=1 Tax=Scomber scombrus TaxID=13677 RepID=A0AAV1PH89_SCOSC
MNNGKCWSCSPELSSFRLCNRPILLVCPLQASLERSADSIDTRRKTEISTRNQPCKTSDLSSAVRFITASSNNHLSQRQSSLTKDVQLQFRQPSLRLRRGAPARGPGVSWGSWWGP